MSALSLSESFFRYRPERIRSQQDYIDCMEGKLPAATYPSLGWIEFLNCDPGLDIF